MNLHTTVAEAASPAPGRRIRVGGRAGGSPVAGDDRGRPVRSTG
jgi:hypothetical protein